MATNKKNLIAVTTVYPSLMDDECAALFDYVDSHDVRVVDHTLDAMGRHNIELLADLQVLVPKAVAALDTEIWEYIEKHRTNYSK